MPAANSELEAGTRSTKQGMSGDALSTEAVMKLATPMLAIFLIGIAAWAIQKFAL